MISVLLFFCMSGCGFVAMRLLVEFRRHRMEARLGRAIRMAFIQ